jgi:hypothetical protein
MIMDIWIDSNNGIKQIFCSSDYILRNSWYSVSGEIDMHLYIVACAKMFNRVYPKMDTTKFYNIVPLHRFFIA